MENLLQAPQPGHVVFKGGRVLTLDARSTVATAVAVRHGRIAEVGCDDAVCAGVTEATTVVELAGRTLMPGLIDGHAHLDREGLRDLLPSVSGCASIEALIARLRAIAERTPAGQWIVTMPLGESPEYQWSPDMYLEGRLPDRHDLDRATTDHPVLIRCAWGYWPARTPLVSIANGAALDCAGIGRNSRSPSPNLRIETDAAGMPTGRFFEDDLQPLAEFTLFRHAPHFTQDDRIRTLAASMRYYNRYGTTGIFEGHGAAPELVEAYRAVCAAGQQTVRARLVFSPGWSDASDDDVRQWVGEQAGRLGGKGQGDEWLRLEGLYSELQSRPDDVRLRAACAPRTGWAGFRYDCGLPPDALKTLLREAARQKLRVCAIQTAMVDTFLDVAREAAIDDLRWVVAHPATLDESQIRGIGDNGIVVTTLTASYIWKRGLATLHRIGKERENTICPIRSLLESGTAVSLATDNSTPSLWPSVWHAVARVDRDTGAVVAPEQRIGREDALRCATVHGAWLCLDERERGSIEVGKQADMIVLREDPLTMPLDDLCDVQPDMTWVDGRLVYAAGGQGDELGLD